MAKPEAYGVCKHRFSYKEFSFSVIGIQDVDGLVDSLTQEQFQQGHELLPYWAELWPSAKGLAMYLIDQGPICAGPVLDLGCGLGLTAMVAAKQGAKVIAADVVWDALRFCRANCCANTVQSVYPCCLNWQDPCFQYKFPLILAADVLYESKTLEPVSRFVQTHLAPHGTALFASSKRPHVPVFLSQIKDKGIHWDSTVRTVREKDSHVDVWIYRIQNRVE